MTLQPSKYQEALLAWAADPAGGNGVVEAMPGSGKTTSLSMVAKVIPKQITALSFMKEAAKALALKMPQNVDSSTISSVCHRALTRHVGGRVNLRAGLQGDSRLSKNREIIRILQIERGEIPRWVPPGQIDRVVRLAKSDGLVPDGVENMTGLVPDTEEQWLSMFDHHGVATDDRLSPTILIESARKVLRAGIKWALHTAHVIDFDDQPYMSALLDGITFPTTPWVFCDELQDTSPLQASVILRLIESGGRFLGVGDKRQAIYGFRGADVYAMEAITRQTSATTMPLSYCYRCGTDIVALAREIAPEIESPPGQHKGLVEYRDEWRASEFLPGDLAICRNRAPMIKLAYSLLGNGVKVRVLGNGGSRGILDFIRSFRERLVDDLMRAVEKHTLRLVARAEKNDDDQAASDAIDQQEMLRTICTGTRAVTVDDLIRAVKDLFEGPVTGKVLVGTIHGVKGLEADRVFFLDEHLIPSRGAKKDWQVVQEENLKFVALTRARNELRFINSEDML